MLSKKSFRIIMLDRLVIATNRADHFALAATLVGCSCPLSPRASIEGCTDANGFACFDRMAASQPIELKPASFKTESATTEFKSTIAAKTQKPSSARARDRAHLAMKTTKSTAADDSDTTRACPSSNALRQFATLLSGGSSSSV